MDDDNEREPKESLRNRYAAAGFISLISFCCGNAIGWLSPALIILKNENTPLNNILSNRETSIIASCLCFGGFIGTPLFSYIIDKYGRRICALTSAILFMISWIIISNSTTSDGIMLARSFAGIGCTGAIIVVPVYLNEISKCPKQSKLQLLTNIANNIGIFSSYILGTYLKYFQVVWFNLSVPVVFFIIFVWIPDTPIFLVKNRKIKEAIESIAWLTNLPLNSHVVKDALISLTLSNDTSYQKKTRNNVFKEFIYFCSTSENFRKSFYRCFTLFTFQGCIGVFAILCFASEIFKQSGGILSFTTMAIIIATQQLVASCVSILLMNRLNKKIRLTMAFFIASIALLSFGTYNYLKTEKYDLSMFSWVPLLSICITVVMFTSAIAVIPYQILKEAFAGEVLKIVNAIIIMWMWVVAFVVSQFYVSLTEEIYLHGTFWMYGTVAMIGGIFVLVFIPIESLTSSEEIADCRSIELVDKRENTSDTLL